MEIKEIRETVIQLLKTHGKELKITADKPEKFEMSGTKEVMQGKKKVDGHYFCTVLPKPKDVRFYFFPTYTHADKILPLPENLAKALKGKSCFHIKKWDDDMEKNLTELIKKGIKLYAEDGLI